MADVVLPVDFETLERIADGLLQRAGAGSVPDVVELASHAGLSPAVGDVQRAEFSRDGTLVYRGNAPRVDQRRWLSDRIAGFLLRQRGLDDSQASIAQLTAALQLPREAFKRHCDLMGWNLRELQQLYADSSMGTLGLRVAMLYEAVVTWFDHGDVRWRFISPALRAELETPTHLEQHLAAIALEADSVLSPRPRMWGFPLYRRVGGAIVLCDARELLTHKG